MFVTGQVGQTMTSLFSVDQTNTPTSTFFYQQMRFGVIFYSMLFALYTVLLQT